MEQSTLSHVMTDSAEVTSYKFAGSRLSQINHYNKANGEVAHFDKYEYDSKNRVAKSSSYASGNNALLSEQLYTYNTNGELAKTAITYFEGGNAAYASYTTFEYDSNRKLQKKNVFEGEETAEGAGKLKSFTTYETLPNGNYTLEKQYIVDENETAQLFSTTSYSYDTSNNPFFAFAEPGTAVSPNNQISAKTLVHGSKKEYSYTYAYKYDERSFPQSQTVTSPTGKRETFTYLYSN